MRLSLAFSLLSAAFLVACAGGGGHDGGFDAAGTDFGPNHDAGPGMDGSGGGPACGTLASSCCPGSTCELGLRCGRGALCCAQSGPGGAVCHSSADCCTGLTCTGGACVAPTGSGCTGSGDCATGEICTGGRCTHPAAGATCGAMSQMCCAGFTCNSGLACHSGTCTACGDTGQPCCDGATGCTGATLCMGGMCTVPMMCGNSGQPCCMPGASCSGSLSCTAGTCGGGAGMSTTMGGMGQPCLPHNTCNDGLVCNPAMRMCVMAPTDCGTDGQMCCTSEVMAMPGMGACSGSLHCQSGACGMCAGPSLTCALGGILPGNQCCNGSTCRLGLGGLRCCQGVDQPCTNDLDCCGLTHCMGGMCSGSTMGSFCIDSSECAMGLTCQSFQCQTAPPMCTDLGGTCMASGGTGMCCTGLSCRPQDYGGATTCCSEADGSCTSSSDCCGQMLCNGNTCMCAAEGGACADDGDCCDSMACVVGTCVNDPGCTRVGTTCDVTAMECCTNTACSVKTPGGTDYQCCAPSNAICATSADCCGAMTCQMEVAGADGGASGPPRCQCRTSGQSCASARDCCGGSTCTSGMCS